MLIVQSCDFLRIVSASLWSNCMHSLFRCLCFAAETQAEIWARIGFCMSNPLCLFQAYLGCLVHVAVVHFDDFFMDISCHCYDPRHCPLPSDGTASCWQLYLCKGRGLHEQSVVLISPWSGFVEMSVQLLIADFQNFHGDLLPLL